MFDKIKSILNDYELMYFIDKVKDGYSIKLIKNDEKVISNILNRFRCKFEVEILFENNKVIRFRIK